MAHSLWSYAISRSERGRANDEDYWGGRIEMTDLPLVSVVIATRNRPQLLRAAIDAVVGQTYPGPIECLIVFDRTDPDRSLETPPGPRVVRVMDNDRSPGLAGARNSGILAASGELVAFCDDDDVWRPTKIERQVAQMGAALTSVTGIVIDYGGRTAERVPDPATFTLTNLVRDRLMEAHPSTVMMRRAAIIDRIGLVDEALPGSYGEDFDFIIRALQAGPISIVEEPLVVVRWGQSMFSRDWKTIIAAIDYMIDKHEVFRADRRALARLYGRRAFANAALGVRGTALRDVWRTVRLSPTQKRAYVTLLVIAHIVSAESLLDMAHKRGRGI